MNSDCALPNSPALREGWFNAALRAVVCAALVLGALVDHWRGTLPGRASATTQLVKKGRAKGGREGGSWEVNHDNLPSALKEKPQPDHHGSDETHYTPIVVSLRRSIET